MDTSPAAESGLGIGGGFNNGTDVTDGHDAGGLRRVGRAAGGSCASTRLEMGESGVPPLSGDEDVGEVPGEVPLPAGSAASGDE